MGQPHSSLQDYPDISAFLDDLTQGTDIKSAFTKRFTIDDRYILTLRVDVLAHCVIADISEDIDNHMIICDAASQFYLPGVKIKNTHAKGYHFKNRQYEAIYEVINILLNAHRKRLFSAI